MAPITNNTQAMNVQMLLHSVTKYTPSAMSRLYKLHIIQMRTGTVLFRTKAASSNHMHVMLTT